MKILMIYEEIPESSYIYILDDVSDDDWKWMQLTNGRYDNSTGLTKKESAALAKLSIYLQDKERKVPSDVGPLLLRDAKFDYFIHTGFMM